MPLHLEPVRVQPLASPEPLIQAHDPTPTITERHLLPLSVLHQAGLISTNRALSRRVHSVLPEIASRQTKKVRSPHHQMINRVMEVLQIRRPKLAELRLRILGSHDRPEIRLPRRQRLTRIRVHKVTLRHTRNPLLRDRRNLSRNRHIRQRASNRIRQAQDVRHLRRAIPIASTTTVQEQHNRDTTEPMVITVNNRPTLRPGLQPQRRIRQIQSPATSAIEVLIHAHRRKHRPLTPIHQTRHLPRWLNRNQRMRTIILIRPHRHKTTPKHQRILMQQRRLRIKIVRVPTLTQTIIRSIRTRQHQRLHIKTPLNLIHRNTRNVHNSLKPTQLRRHSQPNMLQPLPTLIILLVKLINTRNLPKLRRHTLVK